MIRKYFKKQVFILPFILIFLFASRNVLSSEVTLPKDVEQLDFASGLFERKLYDMAITEYRKFIDTFKESELIGDAYFGIAESYFFAEKYNEAIVQYENLLNTFPKTDKNEISKVRIAQSYFLMKEYDIAFDRLSAMDVSTLNDNESKEYVYLYLSKIYQVKQDVESELLYLEKLKDIAEQKQNIIFAYLEIASIYADQYKFQESLKYYKELYSKNIDDDIKSLCLFKQGEILFLTKDYKNSALSFDALLNTYEKAKYRSNAFLNLLMALYNLGDYNAVLKKYDVYKTIELSHDDLFNLKFLLINTYAKLEQYDLAVAILDKELSRNDLSEDHVYQLKIKKINIFYEAKRFQELVLLVGEEQVQHKAERDYIHYILGEAYFSLGKYELSKNSYLEIIRNFKDSKYFDSALNAMAYVQSKLGDKQQAVELFERYYVEGSDQDKKKAALYNEIIIRKELGQIEDVISKIKIYLTSYKDDKFVDELTFLLASSYSQLKKHIDVITTLEDFIKKFPKSTRLFDAYFLLAFNYQADEKYDLALEYYQKIVDSNVSSELRYAALKNIVNVALVNGDKFTAKELIEKIVYEFPGNDLDMDTYFWLIDRKVEESNYDDIFKILGQSESHAGYKDDVLRVNYYKGVAFKGKGEIENALKYFDIVVSLNQVSPYTAASLIEKGICLKILKKYDEAITIFEKAALEYPNDNTTTLMARFELGNLYRLMNKNDEAAKFFMLVAVLYDDLVYVPDSLFNAGEIFEIIGKKADALTAYREIIKLYPDSKRFSEAQEKVKNLSAQ